MSKAQGRMCAVLVLTSIPAASPAHTREPIFYTGSYNPFTQLYGRPDFFGGSTLRTGEWEARTILTISSHTEPAGTGAETLELDGETYRLAVTAARGIGKRVEVGGTAALLHASGGFLDGIVESWHDIIGANIRFPESGWHLTFGIVEDAFSDMMPDFALYSALSRSF